MTANTSPIFVKNVTGKVTQWTNSDSAATKKTISPTIGAEGSRVHSISVCTDDTTARDVSFYLNDGTTDILLGTIAVPIGSGSTGLIPAVAINMQRMMLPWLSADGGFLIPTGWLLKAAVVTQPTSAKTWHIYVSAGDY